jgi:hypothetical protein
MAGCDDTRQLTETQRQAGYQNQRTGVQQAVRPFTGSPSPANIVDYLNRELFPAVKATRNKLNEVYKQVVDNAPSGNPLGYFFSTSTVNADPTAGRLRLDQALQDFAGTIRASVFNTRLQDVSEWLVVMSGSATDPLGVVTLSVAGDPSRFIRFDLDTMTGHGDYWDLGVTVIEASHSNPFVDGSEVTVSFIPGVAAGGGTGAVVRIPGQPFYDVMARPFHAVGNGIADDTAAINAAIAAANLVPGTIYLGPVHRITGALTPITNNNIVVTGRGPFNGGSYIVIDSAAGVDVFTFSACQYSGVQNVWIVADNVYSDGWAIRFVSCYRPFARDVTISRSCFGVEIFKSTLAILERCNLDDLYGVYGFFARGDNTAACHGTSFFDCSCGTPFPQAHVGAGTAWANSTAYVVGNVVYANSNLYQCVQAGTSSGAGTGPSGLPSTDVNTVHTTRINDGTAKWVFAMPFNAWFLQGSYASTFEVTDSGCLQGGYGLSVEDTDPGAGSIPLFTRVMNFQVDHVFGRGIRLSAGAEARIENFLVTSMVEGFGAEVESSYSGNWEFVAGTIFGCNKGGFLIRAGDGLIANYQIGGVSGVTSNTYDCIAVENGADNFTITGCSCGTMVGATSPASRYGISIAAGSDSFIVEGNRCVGNVTLPILNTPGAALTRIVRNNIPEDAYAAATVQGRARAAGSGILQTLTADQVGELIRKFNVATDSTSSGAIATYSQHSEQTTQVRFTGGSVATIHGIAVTSPNFGQEIEFHVEDGAAAKTFNHESGTAGSAGQRCRTPGGVALVLNANDSARATYYDSRWRFGAVSRAAVTGVTDGDKGDITVSASGATWTVDNDVVSNAKAANMAQSTIKGRAEAAGTGDPTDLTPTQVVAIIDAESPVWTASHRFDSFIQFGNSTGLPATGDIRRGTAATFLVNTGSSQQYTAGAGISMDGSTVNLTGSTAVNITANTTDVALVAADQIDVTAENGVFVRFSPIAVSGGTLRLESGGVLSTPPSGQVALTAVAGVTVPYLAYKTTALSERVGFTANSGSIQTASAAQTNSTTNITVTSVAPSANSWEAGTVWKLQGFFTYLHTAAATPTITVELLIGGVVAQTVESTPASSAGTFGARVEGTIVCRTTGAGGTAMASLLLLADFGTNLGNTVMASHDNTTSALNTTGAVTLLLRVRMTTAVASNTLTVIEGYATRLA